MENLQSKKQQASSSRLMSLFYLVLGLMTLIVIAEVFFWLKLDKEKRFLIEKEAQQTDEVLSEEQLSDTIIRVVYAGERPEDADILVALEEIKKYDPQKPPEDLIQYTYYTTILSTLVGEYYASGDNPESRNSEILKILAKIREMARENPNFKEDHWQVEGVDSY